MSEWQDYLPDALRPATVRARVGGRMDNFRATDRGRDVFRFGPYIILPFAGLAAAFAPTFFGTKMSFLIIVVALYVLLRITDSLFGVAVLALALVYLPTDMDAFERNIMFNVALFTLLGIGLNVVVGYAGLLDLGYVAFFATGAYLYALITAPDPGASEWAQTWDWGLTFWAVVPMALVIAALIGVLLGIPVLRLRGDYLAIVTLGFGEIIRIMINNEEYYTNGAQGMFLLPKPPFFGRTLDTAYELYLVVIVFAAIAVFCAQRILNSRVGRAWEAIREDEDVASAMGIDTTIYKLMAFAIGAAIGGVGGVVIAAKQGSVFPPDFSLEISINVLAVVIIGGMGNVRGIVLGALLVVGLPDILRDFSINLGPIHLENIGADYRLVIFGAALVAIMIFRPEGFLPSKRRAAEFRQADLLEQELAT